MNSRIDINSNSKLNCNLLNITPVSEPSKDVKSDCHKSSIDSGTKVNIEQL